MYKDISNLDIMVTHMDDIFTADNHQSTHLRWTMYYTVHDESGKIVYVGHSRMKGVNMAKIEQSERSWEALNYGPSAFREALVARGQKWQFRWLSTLKSIDQETAWEVMRLLIQALQPEYNISKNPKASAETAERFSAIDYAIR